MNEDRILITGAKGQLGQALQKRFPKAIAASRTTLDINDPAAYESFDWSQIDVIVNAAAYTNVDEAETPEGQQAAWLTNGTAVMHLAKTANTHKLTLINFSSDYVLDGKQDNHHEDEPLAPLSVYGQSKAAGELATRVTSKHYLLRTSWVIGEGKNFVRTMVSLAERDISPSVVGDQVGRLTFASTLVDAVEHLLKTKCAYGVYNVTNSGDPASWAEITSTIFKNIGREDLTVTPVTTAEYFANKPEAAPRPLQSAFDLTKITQTGLVLRDWHDDLYKYLQQEQAIKKEQA